MIARIYRFKSGKVLLEMSDDLRESIISRDVESVSAAQEIMHRCSSDWELVQEMKTYRLNQKLIRKEETDDKNIFHSL